MFSLRDTALRSRLHRPGFLMLLMLLCFLSRVLCPLLQGPVRHWTAAIFQVHAVPARRVETSHKLQLTEETAQAALPAPMEDGAVPVAEPARFVQDLPQPSPLAAATASLPISEAATYSPLRI